MIAPAAPPTAAPMIAPRAVEPVAWPITPPATAPPAAPIIAPCSFLLSVCQPTEARSITIALATPACRLNLNMFSPGIAVRRTYRHGECQCDDRGGMACYVWGVRWLSIGGLCCLCGASGV